MSPVGRSLLAVAALVSGTVVSAQTAHAQHVPQCTGNDADGARRARTEALRHYRNATRGSAFNPVEMNAALRSFDDACAAGDNSALEFRAYALAGLGRYVEAAESLDEFARLHPLDSQPADVRDRVNSQRGQILAQVSTLDVTSPVTGATVSVNGRTVGTVPVSDLRVTPGRTTIEVSASGYRTVRRDVDLTAGSTRVEAIEMEAAPGGRRHARSENSSGGSDDSGGGSISPLAIAAGVGGLVLIGGGIGAAIWRSDRADVYNRYCFPEIENCAAVRSEYGTATTLEITAFVAGGVLVAGAVVIAVINLTSGHESAEHAHATRALCVPDLANPGVSCAVSF